MIVKKNKKIKSEKHRKNRYKGEEIINLEDIINLQSQIKKAIKYIYNFKKYKKNVHDLLINMKDYNNNNIVTGLKVEFIRNGKTYNKDLCIIMTKDMIKNIKLKGNTQYFSDTTCSHHKANL